MKKTGVVILAIVLVVVIGVELFLFLEMKSLAGERGFSGIVQMLSGGERSGESAGAPITESPAMTPEPPPTPEPVTPTPIPTEVPTEAPAAATPEPTLVPVTDTPAPTAEPTPTAVPSHSGSCSSNTGTVLDMYVDWKTEDLGNGTARVTVTGRISSYSLDVGGTSVTVTLGDQSATCLVGSILISRDDQTVTDLFSTTLDVPSGVTESLTVDWFFNGSYSGIPMPHITAEGTVVT